MHRALFTPPDSPKFNPIEKTWATIKNFIRRLPTLRREAVDHVVPSAMENISLSYIRGWVMHAGDLPQNSVHVQ